MTNSVTIPSIEEKIFVGYFQSWSENRSQDPKQLQLANVASYVNMVVVSFLKPDASYSGNYNLANTGLFTENGQQPIVDGSVVKEAIALLKQRNPKTKVLVSVGGDNYQNFADLNTTAIASVVKDFGFDGVDIDYLPSAEVAQCQLINGRIQCGSDNEYRRIVSEIRQALPRPSLVTLTGWSTGGYGEGDWANSQPANGPWMGLLLNLLRSPQAKEIDQLHVTSYNASTDYNPQEALEAYQHYFQGKIVMAVHVPPENWPKPDAPKHHVYTIPEVRQLTQAVIDKNAAGVMQWSLQKTVPNPSDEYPNAQMMAKEICQLLSLGNCDEPLFGVGV